MLPLRRNTIRILPLLCTVATLAGRAQDVAPPAPMPVTPNPAQLRWHKAETIMFAHFGMKTFYPSGDHMGYGKEDPQRFNPVKFDPAQWVEAAKGAGFRGIVLTTKHHDGFCNWQTDTTDHCVRSSPWKDGKGDVVRELAEACRAGGIQFGVYVSIIDKHFEGAGSPKHATYGEYYLEQIRELSTRYGRIDEYWFDGFNAANLKMDYQKVAELIREKQPEAVVYDSHMMAKYIPDRCLNWPGNHGGLGPDQEYVRPVDGVDRWYPSEPSIIFQGNWFHNGSSAAPLRRMQDDYLNSTGHGVTPLLNIAPNQEGLVDEDAAARLREFKAWVDGLHTRDLARAPEAKITSTGHRGNAPAYAPGRVADGDFETYFATDDGVTNTVVEVELGGVREIEGVILQEYIPLGQRVESYTVECRVDGQWKPVATGRRIGFKRILLEGRGSSAGVQFPAADAVRLKIDRAAACPLISGFQVIGGEPWTPNFELRISN